MSGGTLVDHQIQELIEKNQLLDPYTLDSLSSASYELRVGSYRSPSDNKPVGPTSLPAEAALQIKAGGFMLVGTIERLRIPNDVLGMLYLRSTYARLGFVSWFQGVVDPGFEGTPTILLHNLGGRVLTITGGDRICHLVLERLSTAVARPYRGRYYLAPGATPARYRAGAAQRNTPPRSAERRRRRVGQAEDPGGSSARD